MPNIPPRRSGWRWLIALVAAASAFTGVLFWTPQIICGTAPPNVGIGSAYSDCVDSGLLVGALAGVLVGGAVCFLLLRLLDER